VFSVTIFFCDILIFIQVGQLFAGPSSTVASNAIPLYLLAMKVTVAIFFFWDVCMSKCRIFWRSPCEPAVSRKKDTAFHTRQSWKC